MRKAIGFVALTLALSLPAVAQTRSADSPERLFEQLTLALESQDLELLDRLHDWKGVDAELAAALRGSLEKRFFDCGGRPARLHAGAAGSDEMVRGGETYRPSLEIEGQIEIVCTSGTRASFLVPYGQRAGRFYLANVVRESAR